MPVLETTDGKPVEVTPADADAINARFTQAMNDDKPDEQAPPKRQPEPATAAAPKKRGRPPKEDKARTAATAAVVLDDAQRAQGVTGLVQVGAGLCLVANKATGNDAYQADAIALASSADAIADACVQTAKADARFAAALDKVCRTGPYAALVGVMVGVGAQLVRNHRPSLSLPGTVHPDELLKAQAANRPGEPAII